MSGTAFAIFISIAVFVVYLTGIAQGVAWEKKRHRKGECECDECINRGFWLDDATEEGK